MLGSGRPKTNCFWRIFQSFLWPRQKSDSYVSREQKCYFCNRNRASRQAGGRGGRNSLRQLQIPGVLLNTKSRFQHNDTIHIYYIAKDDGRQEYVYTPTPRPRPGPVQVLSKSCPSPVQVPSKTAKPLILEE